MLPHAAPRRPEELEQLKSIWRSPSGWRIVTDVNNTVVGLLYLGTALLFFLLAGLLALLMRSQLALPQNRLVGPDLYNQLFTVHGTTMMFLFAVPAMEAVSVYLLPNMQAARDLPFRGPDLARGERGALRRRRRFDRARKPGPAPRGARRGATRVHGDRPRCADRRPCRRCPGSVADGPAATPNQLRRPSQPSLHSRRCSSPASS
jgi:hypothetical protein